MSSITIPARASGSSGSSSKPPPGSRPSKRPYGGTVDNLAIPSSPSSSPNPKATKRHKSSNNYNAAGLSDLDVRTRRKPEASTARSSSKPVSGSSTAAPSFLPPDFFDTRTNTSTATTNTTPQPVSRVSHHPSVSNTVDIDEDEWAAFEADIAAETSPQPPTSSSLTTTIHSSTIISAPPVSASDLLTNGDSGGPGDTSTGNSGGAERALQNEAAEEVEDARQKLAEEFEEMEGLEQRVLRLKQQREALRLAGPSAAAAAAATRMEVEVGGGEEGDDEEDEDDDDEDDDDWIHFAR